MRKEWEKIFVWGVIIIIAYTLYSRLIAQPVPSVTATPQSPGAPNIVPNFIPWATNAFNSLIGS